MKSLYFCQALDNLFHFSESFDFDYVHPAGEHILKIIMDQLKKFEEQMPLKAVRKNKMYTIKNHSLNYLHAIITELIIRHERQKQTTLLENQMEES